MLKSIHKTRSRGGICRSRNWLIQEMIAGKQAIRNELNVPPGRHMLQAANRGELLRQPFDTLRHVRPVVIFAFPENHAIKRQSPGLLRRVGEPQTLEWNRKENNVAVGGDPAGVIPQGVEGEVVSFDTLWDNAGRVTPDGYIVFFSIPFKSLRFSHAPEQTWGLALYRVILRKSEYDYWPYVTQRVEELTQQFAPVTGLEHVSPVRNIQLIPYGLLASDHFLNQPIPTPANPTPAPSFLAKFAPRAGLDAKFVAKDSLTFDVTLNPDSSQVESDDPHVTINQRFAVFFPEKRPFFIEKAGFSLTPIIPFF